MRNPYCSHIFLPLLPCVCNPGSLVSKSLVTPSPISKGKSCVHHLNSVVGEYWDLSQLSKASQTEEMMEEACLSVSQKPAVSLFRFQKLLFYDFASKKKMCLLKIMVGLASSLLNQTETLP